MASITDQDLEIQQLKGQIQDLRNEVEEKENQAILSAELGKQLLETNSELNRQLVEIQESYLMQIEELRQENYNMKMRIENDVRAKENFTNEMENLKEKLHEDAKQELSRVTSSHSKKVNELEMEIESLQSEIEKSTLVTEQLQQKVLKQDELLAEAHKYSKQLQGMSALEMAVEELKEECVLMKFKNDELKIMLTDANDERQQLLFDQQNLVQKIDSLKENLEEKTNQAKTWFDTLQDSRQQVLELEMEVSVLKAEVLNRSHKEKGNSLFGEIEDRRLELQQKFTTVRAKYESLQKTHQIVKKQLHQYKSQILPMLQMAGNQADSSKIKRLEAALSQSRSEIQRLYVKIRDVEKGSEERGLSTRLEKFHDAFTDFKDKKDYVTFLQNELNCLRETIGDLKSKEEILTVKLLAETDKRRETESLLHVCEVKKEKLEHDIVRLRLKLEELKIKLQQAGKTTEQVREPSSARKNKRSIWNDASLFRKTETSHENPKDSSYEKPPEVRRPEKVTDAGSQHSIKFNNVKNIQPKISESAQCLLSKSDITVESAEILPSEKPVESAEIIPSKVVEPSSSAEVVTLEKVRPVGRVSPLNEPCLPYNENEDVGSKEKVKPQSQHEQECAASGGRKQPLSESNNDPVPQQAQDNLNTGDISGTKILARKKNQIPENQNPEHSISRENKNANKRDPHYGRVIHVKKDVRSKNECQQQ